MNHKKRIISAILGGRVDTIPAWLPVVGVTVPMMERAQAPWPEAHWDAELMAKLAAMPWELTGLPAITVPFCLSLEAEALGCQIDSGTLNRTPSVKKHAFSTPEEFTMPENLLETGRIPIVLKAIELLQEQLGDSIPVNAKVTGAFTIAGHVFGVSNFISWIKTDPERAREAVRVVGDVSYELIGAFEEHGADIISLSDPTSSGDLISGEQYRDFVLPHHQQAAKTAKRPSVLHICGNTIDLLRYIRDSGFDAYSFEEKIDVLAAKKILGDRISLVGNIAPVATMLQGTPEMVTAEAISSMKDGIDLLSSGCTLSPLTPLENIRALAEAPEKYRIPEDPMDLLHEIIRGISEGVRG